MAFGNYNFNPYVWSNPYAMQQGPAPQMPAPTQPQPMLQQGNGIRWVQGEAGAKGYPVAPGESVFLMDSEASMAYLKTVDMGGVPSMRYYQITEVSPEQAAPKADTPQVAYATQDELLKLRDEVRAVRKLVKSMRTMEDDDDE